MVRIGIVGLGSIGRRHARLARELTSVEVLECDPADANTLSFEELLARGPDGVIIASPDPCHVTQTLAALSSGAAVLVEKPLAASSKDAEQLLGSDTNRVLTGYVLRQSQWFRVASDIVSSGALGDVVSAQATLGAYDTITFARNRFATAAKNRLYFDYSHEWDYLSSFLGPVTEVAATARQACVGELRQDPDVVDAILRFESGASGTLHLDYVQSPARRQCLLIGSKASLAIDAVSGAITLSGREGVREWDVAEHRDESYRRQLRHFLGIIAGREKPLSTVLQGYRAVCVAEALILSASTRTWQPVTQALAVSDTA